MGVDILDDDCRDNCDGDGNAMGLICICNREVKNGGRENNSCNEALR